jgi:imidazolonepropionase-like amidohydrolase
MLTKDSYMAIAKEANTRNIPFAGHVPDDVTIWEAINAKQKSLEHLIGILEGCTKNPEKLALYKTAKYPSVEKMIFLKNTFDEVRFDSLLKILASSESWICPTLTVLRGISMPKDSSVINDERIKYLPPYITDYWKNSDSKQTIDVLRDQYEFQKKWMGKMKRAGVKIIGGTDYPNPYCFPGFSLHDELSLMVEGGMTPYEALQTVTLNPALFFKKEKDYGSVSTGKFASLILLNKNPLDNINNTKEIYGVLLKGKYFNRAALDSLLKNAVIK